MRILTLLLLITTLYGCASLDEGECRRGNWKELGENNGRDGKNLYNAHMKACKEYGILPDPKLYRTGFREGVKSYCTPENGLKVGIAGESYNKVCPRSLERKFLKKYNLGKKIHNIQSDITTSEAKIAEIESKLDSSEYTPQQKNKLHRDMRKAESKLSRAKKKMIVLKLKTGYNTEDIIDLI